MNNQNFFILVWELSQQRHKKQKEKQVRLSSFFPLELNHKSKDKFGD